MLRIIVDSSANIFQSEAEELGVKILPLGINFNDEEFLDDVNISIDEFYTKLTTSKIFPKTSLLGMELMENEFEDARKAGDDVLLMVISSQLSGTYNCAKLVKEQGNYNNVYIYDTLGATAKNRILVDVAIKNCNKPPEEIIKILDEVRENTRVFASLDTLEYLARGGRLSKASAAIGNMLNLKPILSVETDGTLDVKAKVIGLNKAISTVTTLVEKEGGINTDYPVYFLYSMHKTNGEKLQAKYPQLTNAKLLNLCSVIGAHIGPGVAGICFVKKNKA